MSIKPRLLDFTFDEQDANLFQVPDARLRADALRHSILPRLHGILNECISSIRDVYGLEVLEDSIISYFPHFREKRNRELDLLYDSAFVGLGGKRIKNKWHGFSRRDGKPVQILPFRFALTLTENGIGILLENGWLNGLADSSFGKLFDFHIENESTINMLCFYSGISPIFFYGENTRPLSSFQEHYSFMKEAGYIENHFNSQDKPYPIKINHLDEIIFNYTLFYPVYDSYIQLAKGEPIRFHDLMGKANDWLESIDNKNEESKAEENPEQDGFSLLHIEASQLAENRIKVMPALRWQVFQRDDWKCVACGRSSQDEIILHVDHIIPRSKGGKDSLDNYQTLCNICNLGKSNRDNTDLRKNSAQQGNGI